MAPSSPAIPRLRVGCAAFLITEIAARNPAVWERGVVGLDGVSTAAPGRRHPLQEATVMTYGAVTPMQPRRRGSGHDPMQELPTGTTCRDCAHFAHCRRFARCLPDDEVCRYDPPRFMRAFRLDEEPQ